MLKAQMIRSRNIVRKKLSLAIISTLLMPGGPHRRLSLKLQIGRPIVPAQPAGSGTPGSFAPIGFWFGADWN